MTCGRRAPAGVRRGESISGSPRSDSGAARAPAWLTAWIDFSNAESGGLAVTGKVVEDRGRIGAGGDRLLRVQIDVEPDGTPMFIELAEDAVTMVKHVA